MVLWSEWKMKNVSASSQCLSESSCLMSGRQNTPTTDRGISFASRCFALCWFSLTHSQAEWLPQICDSIFWQYGQWNCLEGLALAVSGAPTFCHCPADSSWIHKMKIANSGLPNPQLFALLTPDSPSKVCVKLGSDPWQRGGSSVTGLATWPWVFEAASAHRVSGTRAS